MYGIINAIIDSRNIKIVETELIKKELKTMAKKNKKGTIHFQEVAELPRARFWNLVATSYLVYFITVIILAVSTGGN
jgi:hypothetical protein